MKPKILLHICCAPCATYPFGELKKEYDVTAYFYDPNIHPQSEYEMRRDEALRYFQDKCEVRIGEYDVKNWVKATKGLEGEPERGARCTVCYDLRLWESARFAAQEGFTNFATVLSTSPHKDALRINASGQKAGEHFGITYVIADWKKQGGYLKSIEMSRQNNLRRQDYCGCVYSLIERNKRHNVQQKRENDRQK